MTKRVMTERALLVFLDLCAGTEYTVTRMPSQDFQAAVQILTEAKLIDSSKITAKGMVFRDMLLATPLPVRSYTDPRAK